MSDSPPIVQVSVIEGSWEWACAMHQAGVAVCNPTAHHLATPRPTDPRECRYHGGRNDVHQPAFATGWVLLNDVLPSVVVKPGTFAWAVAHILEGKRVRRRGKHAYLDVFDLAGSREDREDIDADDWYVLP